MVAQEKTETITIHLNKLHRGSPGVTPEIGGYFAQAAAVCFESQNHASGIRMTVDGDFDSIFIISWDNTTDQMRRSLADMQNATEFGAYGIAALIIENLTSLTIVEKSRKGTGFDFWLGEKDDDELFQGKKRLEVSGILNGDESSIRSRVKTKLEQIARSDGKLPAYVVVVEFSQPRSRIVEK